MLNLIGSDDILLTLLESIDFSTTIVVLTSLAGQTMSLDYWLRSDTAMIESKLPLLILTMPT
jgi:hypothetical protein